MEASIVQAPTPVINNQQQVKELTRQVNKYQELLNATRTGTWEYDIETGHISYSPVFLSLLGRKPDDPDLENCKTLTAFLTHLAHPDDVKAFLDGVKNCYENAVEDFGAFIRMKHTSGNWRWIALKGTFITDTIDKPTSTMLGMATDITIHKEREDGIKREQLLLQALIDNLPDLIYIKDEEGRKVISNPADVASLGAVSAAEIVGKTDIELIGGEIGERGYNDDMEVLQSGEPILNREEFFTDLQGNTQWILTSKVPLRDNSGKVFRILGIGHNITKRKQSEEALTRLNAELNQQSYELNEQTEELKALNEQLIQQKEQEMEKAIAQGKFEIASEVLHDIGNALVGFGSYLNRVNRALDRDNTDTVKNLGLFLKNQQTAIAEAIGPDKASALVAITEGITKTQVTNKEEISASVKELLHIISHIQEILNIQRQFVRSHEGAHDRKPVDLGKIIDDCRSMLFASFDKKGIELKVNIEPGKHVIKGDHTKLMQVLLNILKNSVEAIDYEATDKKISISLAAHNEVIELRVQDNGLGFDAQTADHLFERGFTTKKSGTGLGLYNCKSIIESHTGSFSIHSAGPGRGSVTVIKFMHKG